MSGAWLEMPPGSFRRHSIELITFDPPCDRDRSTRAADRLTRRRLALLC